MVEVGHRTQAWEAAVEAEEDLTWRLYVGCARLVVLEEMEQLRSSGPVKASATRFLSTTTRSVTSTSNTRLNRHGVQVSSFDQEEPEDSVEAISVGDCLVWLYVVTPPAELSPPVNKTQAVTKVASRSTILPKPENDRLGQIHTDSTT